MGEAMQHRWRLMTLPLVVVAVLVAGCVASVPRDTSGVGREPWGTEFHSLAEKVNAAIDGIPSGEGFALRIPGQPTAPPGDDGQVYAINEVRNQLFPRGNYRLTILCAGNGTLRVSFDFNAGRSIVFHSAGVGNPITCTNDVATVSAGISLPIGANRLSITADPVDMYGNHNEPRAAIGFTVERVP